MEYTQLDSVTVANAIRARMRDLEFQYLQLSLRVQAPDLNQPINEMDSRNTQMLENSLSVLKARLDAVVNAPASTPATAPAVPPDVVATEMPPNETPPSV